MNLVEYAHRIPKAELHVHLEGSILPHTLLKLAERNAVPLPASDVSSLREFYSFRDFAHFIEVYKMITGCLKTPDDYALIAYEFGSECHRQNIRYAEVTFTIFTNMEMTGLPWQDILSGLNRGRVQAYTDFGVHWQWVFDIVRDNPETQQVVLEITLAARDQGVVALGLGGSEAEYPADLFIETFQHAYDVGLHRVPHTGEHAGPTSIWNTIQRLHAERLGHGVQAIGDPDLVAYLRQNQVPLECCPTSNVTLGVYPDYAHHPLRRLWDAGCLVTVNSDDPPLFNTDLNQEYQVLVEHFGFTATELEKISRNAIQASFLSPQQKAEYTRQFTVEFSNLRRYLAPN
jgi:aminodeoxyfutalosine deaminase